MNEYNSLVESGWCPIWVGIQIGIDDEDLREIIPSMGIIPVLIKFSKDGKQIWKNLNIDGRLPSELRVLRKRTAIEPESNYGFLHSKYLTKQVALRIAAIKGVTSFSRYGYGLTEPVTFDQYSLRVVGLDLEQSSHERGGAFPLPHDMLISASIVTWDGRVLCRYTVGTHNEKLFKDKGYDVSKVSSSTELVDWIIDWLVEESPDVVVIHNGYNYDIPRMAAHCSPLKSHFFKDINLGKVSKGMDIDIPGVIMFDSYHYIDKVHRSDYESISLDALAIKLGVSGKHEQPSFVLDPVDFENQDISDMLEYNARDSYLHIQVALKSNCIIELMSMCPLFKCPIQDICKYITGSMVSTMISSYAKFKLRVS